jgi:tetratricopeptide (TPR) repeat protein
MLALFLLMAASAFAQTRDDAQALIRQGLADIYDLNFKAAQVKLDSLIRLDPLHPRGFFYMSEYYLFQIVSGYRADSLDEKFLFWNDKTLAATDEKTNEALFYRGSAYGNLARYQAIRGEFVKAFLNAKKAKRLHETVLENDKNYSDAYVSIGAYNYYAAALPKWIEILAGLFGLGGDRQTGIQQLEMACSGGGVGAIEAKFFLANAYYEEGRYETSLAYYDELAAQFPHNPYLLNQMAVVQFGMERFSDAEKILKSALALANEQTLPAKMSALFFLGRIAKLKTDYTAAVDYFQQTVAISEKRQTMKGPDPWMTSASYFQIGECMDLLGRAKEAAEFYEKVKNNPRSYRTLVQSAKTRLRSPLSEFEIQVMRGRHLALIGEREQAHTLLTQLKMRARDGNAKFLSQINFYLGRIALDSNHVEEARIDFTEALATQSNDADQKWREPQNHFYLGLCYARLDQKERAAVQLKRCLEFDDYPEYPRIKFRANALLKEVSPP